MKMSIAKIYVARLALGVPFALLLGLSAVQAGNTSNNTSSNQSTNTSSDRWSSNSSSNASSNSSNSRERNRDSRRDERIDERGDRRPGVYRFDFFEYERGHRGVWRSRYTERGYPRVTSQ